MGKRRNEEARWEGARRTSLWPSAARLTSWISEREGVGDSAGAVCGLKDQFVRFASELQGRTQLPFTVSARKGEAKRLWRGNDGGQRFMSHYYGYYYHYCCYYGLFPKLMVRVPGWR